jgi:hypothetical protein
MGFRPVCPCFCPSVNAIISVIISFIIRVTLAIRRLRKIDITQRLKIGTTKKPKFGTTKKPKFDITILCYLNNNFIPNWNQADSDNLCDFPELICYFSIKYYFVKIDKINL